MTTTSDESTPTARQLGGLIQELETRGSLRTVLTPDASRVVTAVDFDSRESAPGHLFVAVPGAEVDGHDYAAAAVERGAVAVIAERALPRLGVPQVLVGSSRSALAVAAAWLQGFPSYELGVVGVTGTDGKTTTSYLVRAMLDACGLGAGMITTVDVVVGGQSYGETGHTTPEAPEIQRDLRRMVDAGDRFAVLESTSHGLALDRVAEVAYDVAVLTNITHEHLDLHGTMEAYVGAKRSLFDRLAVGATNPDKGWPKCAIVNAEDAYADDFVRASREAGAQVVTYAVDPKVRADVSASKARDDGTGLRLVVRTPRWESELQMQLVGHFNVFNTLAAVSVGEALGLDPDAMRRGLEGLDSVPGRLIAVDEGQEFTVYVDFAHTPGALAAALDSLAPHAAARGGGLISVFGSPGRRDVLKRPMMGRAAGERSRVVVLADDDPRDEDRMQILEQIAAGAEEVGHQRDHDLFLIPDRDRAIRKAFEMARPG
ncbi:MAG TPA: UDP-N-acetylmuramoyl-L-alanyl-D-glutamate--2,6-diaminopimelate ligase, partial [Candidatus Limnocylindrales bacterium]|nr:UDP-N-acetylmuramoyl-L-alanyl-D-glutamate--2,6-diaminopimelate ligase [Candidatus Limnocylindrales bacterium]